MPATRARGVLGARIVRLTLIVGAVTIGVTLVAAVVSASHLTAETARNRDLRVIQSVEDSVESHLRSVAAVIDQATNKTQDVGVLEQRVSAAFENNQDSISEAFIADRTGKVFAAFPADADTRKVRTLPSFLGAIAGRTGFLCRFDEGRPEIWMTRTAFDARGEPIFVLARLNTSFVPKTLASASRLQPHRLIMIMQDKAVVGASGGGGAELLRGARWTAAGLQWGAVRAVGRDGAVLQGHYNDIGGIEGIGWRAVILAPVSEQILDTATTVAPPILVLVFGGCVALALAWGLSVRLTRPIKDLERAALKAASGAYIKPLSMDRDDEIGRLGDAFDVLALRINALQDVTQLLASASSLDQVLDGVLRAMGHLVGAGSAAVFLLDEGSARLIPVRSRGFDLRHAEAVTLGEGRWIEEVLDGGGPRTFEGGEDDFRREFPGLSGERLEVVAAPLVVGREALGVVVVARNAERHLTEAEIEMLRTFTAQAAVAVQTSRLFEIESASRRRAEALRSVAEELVRPSSLQAALNVVERIICELFAANDAIIALADRPALGLGSTGTAEADVETHLMEAAYRLLGRRKDSGAAVVEVGKTDVTDRLLEGFGTQRLLLVPIALETDHGGVLAVPLDEEPDSTALEFAGALGDEIALALDNSYFYQRALGRAANLETIFRISQAVGSSLQINVVLNRVLDVVQKILSADAVALMSYDRTRRLLKTDMGRGALPGPVLHLEVAPGEDIPGQVFSRGEPVSVKDLNASTSGVGSVGAEHDLRSLLAVPLLARGRSIGVLMVFASEPSAFSAEDVNTLQTFASQASLAIDTARLYGREHEVASVLQASIVPEALPSYEELEAGSVYAPAGEAAEIGGDYYDLFRDRNGNIWFAIGDVCGKGVYAATKTSMIKYVVRTLAIRGESPSEVVSVVNDMIAETGDPSDIVTLWLGRWNPATGSLVWADGGHPPALLRRASGELVRLEVTGALLGALEGATYDEMEVGFDFGDKLLLYTDGVTEARRGNIFFGEERVAAVLARDKAPGATASALLDDVRGYVQGELRDDVAVLVVAPRNARTAREQGNGGA